MKTGQRLTQEMRLEGELKLAFALELEASVREDVCAHWNNKIHTGIIPTRMRGKVTTEEHRINAENLARDQIAIFERLFATDWKPKDDDPVYELHYFGIGTGEVLQYLIPIANLARHTVIAYDTSDKGYAHGRTAIDLAKDGLPNTVYMADVEFALQLRYIRPYSARKIVLARVLDILDKQEDGWEKIPYHLRKMARTARKLGSFLHYTEILILHPCPEDNSGVVWRDTTPHPLSDILGFMKEEAQVPFETILEGKVNYYGSVYSWIRIRERR